jgi:hypothetical protein
MKSVNHLLFLITFTLTGQRLNEFVALALLNISVWERSAKLLPFIMGPSW